MDPGFCQRATYIPAQVFLFLGYLIVQVKAGHYLTFVRVKPLGLLYSLRFLRFPRDGVSVHFPLYLLVKSQNTPSGRLKNFNSLSFELRNGDMRRCYA